MKLGAISLDGTKVHANASRHSALSHGHIEKIEAHRKAEVQELLALAEQADRAEVPDGTSLPAEIKRHEDRLLVMAEAKAKKNQPKIEFPAVKLLRIKILPVRKLKPDRLLEPDSVDLPEAFHETLEFAVLASRRDPFDLTEIAIRESGLKLLANTEHLHSNWQLMNEYPLSGELLAMSRVWQSPDRMQYIIGQGST